MIREGSPDVTLAYLAKHRNMLAISSFSDGGYWQILAIAMAHPVDEVRGHCANIAW
jgi:hypothetical protein